ncbi:MAG: hypothetical protein V1754_08300 [Pseudomonadota bacterium]
MPRRSLRTVRFSETEAQDIDEYLEANPLFESFSSLARVATLSFIGNIRAIHLQPTRDNAGDRPRFLWDYNISKTQAVEILSSKGLSKKKKWLIGRILKEARFDEVFDYLDLQTIKQHLHELRLPPKVKTRWEYAIERWTQ